MEGTFKPQVSQWENRDALRTFIDLVDTVPILNARLLESKRLLDHAAALMTEVMPELREACMMREQLEATYFHKMKAKKELYDGTAQLEREERRYRIRWLKVERKRVRDAKREKDEAFNRENDMSDSGSDRYSTDSDSQGTLWSSDESETSPKPSRKRSRDEDEDVEEEEEPDRKRKRSTNFES